MCWYLLFRGKLRVHGMSKRMVGCVRCASFASFNKQYTLSVLLCDCLRQNLFPLCASAHSSLSASLHVTPCLPCHSSLCISSWYAHAYLAVSVAQKQTNNNKKTHTKQKQKEACGSAEGLSPEHVNLRAVLSSGADLATLSSAAFRWQKPIENAGVISRRTAWLT